MIEYSKVNVKLTDTLVRKLKTAVKDKTGTTLRMNLKMIDVTICLMNFYCQQDKKQS